MVFFACDRCGETMKKNMVTKHLYRCKTSILSCVDCSVNFTRTNYTDHTKCVSEDKKYGGKNFVETANKGDVKQQAWSEKVEAAINACDDAKLKPYLNKLLSAPNLPRKRAKLLNYLASTNSAPAYLRDKICHVLLSAATENSNTQQKPAHAVEVKTNGTHAEDSSPAEEGGSSEQHKLSKRERKLERQKRSGHKAEKKEKRGGEGEGEAAAVARKRKRHDSEQADQPDSAVQLVKKTKKYKKKKSEEESSDELHNKNQEQALEDEQGGGEEAAGCGSPAKFSWVDAIRQVLESAPEKQLSIKRLQKKVLSEYQATQGSKLISKFNKHLTRNPNLRVHKDRVTLLS